MPPRAAHISKAPGSAGGSLLTNADDGIRVFVDGQKLLDDWSDHAPRTTLKTVTRLRREAPRLAAGM